jgi:hypothetical protein
MKREKREYSKTVTTYVGPYYPLHIATGLDASLLTSCTVFLVP